MFAAKPLTLLVALVFLSSPRDSCGFLQSTGTTHHSSSSINKHDVALRSNLSSFTAKRNSPICVSIKSRYHYYKSTTTTPLAASSSSAVANRLIDDNDSDDTLPSTVTPILLTVLALIISEGIALSTLPLHLHKLGASPLQVGMSTSAFSVAQMFMCPLIVALSSKPTIGRRKTLSLCLIGAALSSAVIAVSTTIPLLIFARFLAGGFAAAIPVAQAGVVDLVSPKQNTLALSRVSAASQTGLVIGPIASAVVQSILKGFGVSQRYLVRGVFCVSAMFALFVALLAIRGEEEENVSDDDAAIAKPSSVVATKEDVSSSNNSKNQEDEEYKQQQQPTTLATEASALPSSSPSSTRYVQLLLRIICLAAGWSMTLSVAIYSLYASKFLNYGQSELSFTYSLGAATVIGTQMFIVPPLAKQIGVNLSCSFGLWILSLGLLGTSIIRFPILLHGMLYMLIRVGTGITDTSTATLVAKASSTKEERANNLGMIQSTRAGARIFTPILSGSLFTKSCQQGGRLAGSLPYLLNAVLALILSPLPLILKRIDKEEVGSGRTKSS